MIQRCHSGIHPKDLYPGRPCSLLLCLQKPGDEYNMNEEEMKMWYTYAMKKRSAVKKKEPTKSADGTRNNNPEGDHSDPER